MIKNCIECGFGLWKPIAELEVSEIGLYSDSRFPGRCILKLNEHMTQLEELDEGLLLLFMKDSQRAIKAILKSTDAQRVNFSILGNAEPHIHAHLIPRVPELEEFPNKSPWNDSRERTDLSLFDETKLIKSIQKELR